MKSDVYRLERISYMGNRLLDAIDELEITKEKLLTEEKLQWMVSTPLFNIGEQANCSSSEFVEAHPDTPWALIAGLRHRLVHNYEGTNWGMISEVLFTEVKPLVAQVDAILADNEAVRCTISERIQK